jgi:hypothetical protein
MSNPLNTPTAIGGKHYILVEEFSSTGGFRTRYVLTYNDSEGDIGDAFTAAEIAKLDANEPVKRSYPIGGGGSAVFRSMNAATLGL